MKKKILLTIAASALLTTSVLAYNGQGCQQQGINKGCSQKQMNTGCGNKMMQKNKMGHKKGNKMLAMFMQLNLSDEQKAQVMNIIKDARKMSPNPHQAFTDSSFDKTKFIQLQIEKREAKIKRKADMIEKIYQVLTKEQKQELKTILDAKDKMRSEGSCNGKNCYGRR